MYYSIMVSCSIIRFNHLTAIAQNCVIDLCDVTFQFVVIVYFAELAEISRWVGKHRRYGVKEL